MNRAILIVICDFIVSAMLSLFTGSAAVSTASGTRGAALDNRTASVVLNELRRAQEALAAERQALLEALYAKGLAENKQHRLEELTRRLAEVRARADMLEKRFKLTRRETGSLSPEELQEQLEREITARYRLHLQKEAIERAAADLRRRNDDSLRQLESLRGAHAVQSGKLEILERQQSAQAKSLAEASSALAVRNAEVLKMREEIQGLRIAGDEQAGKRQEAENALSFTRGKLNATEQELAEAQSRSDRAAKQLAARELELREARKQVDHLQGALKNAVTDLSGTREELAKSREDSKDLELVRIQLAEAREKLRSDVQKWYSRAVVRLRLDMEEKRLLIPTRREGTFFLPAVDVQGKVCVIGELPSLTGNVRERPDYNDLTRLDYTVQDAGGKMAPSAVSGLFCALEKEPAMVFMEIQGIPGIRPLKMLSLEALKQRGVHDLYLFKSSSEGRESATLGGRCSLDNHYLYIRNAARGTGSELRAEPGDFVLTKQGEFAALVVDVRVSDLGRRQVARCVCVPEGIDWRKDVIALPFRGGNGVQAFSRAASPLLKRIRERAQQE